MAQALVIPLKDKSEERPAFALRLQNSASPEWAKVVRANHLTPGLVRYPNIIHPQTGQKGVVLLLPKSTIDNMRSTAAGIPVITGIHRDVSADEQERGLVEGAVVESRWNSDTANEDMTYLVWDPKAKQMVADGAGVSCRYIVPEGGIDWTKGSKNDVPYDGVITAGIYEHLLITSNPRYEDSVSILQNSKEVNPSKTQENTPMEMPKTLKLAWAKVTGGALDNSVEADPSAVVDLGNGKSATLAELIAHRVKVDEKETLDNALKADSEITIDGKKFKLSELKERFIADNAVQPEPKKPAAPKDTPHFNKLENARETGTLEALKYVPPSTGSDAEKLGRELFGSPKKS